MVKNHILLCDFSPVFRKATNVYERYFSKEQLVSNINRVPAKGILPGTLVYINCRIYLIINFSTEIKNLFTLICFYDKIKILFYCFQKNTGRYLFNFPP